MLRIRELREDLGITQKQLAEGIGNTQRNISNWEQGAIEPDLDTIVALADFFDVTLDELFGREQKAPSLDSEIVSIIRRMTPEQKKAFCVLFRQ